MAINKSAGDPATRMLRNASEPFIIHLTGEPYVLTTEQLWEQADTDILGERTWNQPVLKFISFENNTLEFEASIFDERFKIAIGVEQDKLHVCCNCEEPVEKLCIHALKALERIIELKGCGYFERYGPNGMVEIGLKYPKLFEMRTSGVDLTVTPKERMDSVYHFSDETSSFSVAGIMALPVSFAAPIPDYNKVLSYMMMLPHPGMDQPALFLLPCTGNENKAGTDIRAFDKFRTGPENNDEPYFTDDKRLLNALCNDIRQHAESMKSTLLENNGGDHEKLRKLYRLWETAVPYLQKQEFVYQHFFIKKRCLKRKPFKSMLRRIRVKRGRPKIFFQLKDKGIFYVLYLRVAIGGRPLSYFAPKFPFLVANDRDFYFISSIRDAGILEWMQDFDYRLTIFKEHFEEFELKYLNLLREHYPVEQS